MSILSGMKRKLVLGKSYDEPICRGCFDVCGGVQGNGESALRSSYPWYLCVYFIDDKQVVKVLPDGTFQEIVGDGAGAKTFSGNWSVVKVRASEKLSIIFSSYHFENKTNLPGAGEVGDWLTIVRQGNNRVWLVVSDGDGLRCSRGVN